MKKQIIKLSVSFALFILAFAIPQYKVPILFIAYIISGYEVLFSAVSNIFRGQIFDENFLMSIATVGAIAIGEYSEAVAVMLFFGVGEVFQTSAINKSRKTIQSLVEIMPEYANVLNDEKEEKVDPEDVLVGDTIIIKAGEKVPLDCVIIHGASTINTSALTGESAPVYVDVNDEISSGCININGVLRAKVLKTYENSTVSKILELVENASDKKSKTENFITKFAKYYTPTVVILAVLISIIPPLIFEGALFSDWFYRALTFLVISCPCALVISVPLGFFGGIGLSSKYGILVKGSNYLEELSKVNTAVFDKTGTLTKGNFAVSEIFADNKDEILEYVAYAESMSTHPIAKSIKNYYGKEILNSRISKTEEIAGFGMLAVIDGKEVLAGNQKLMQKFDVKFSDNDFIGTKIYVAVDRTYKGYIGISDEIKQTSKIAIEKLNARNIETVMLTGDNEKTADNVAKNLSIKKYFAKLLPEDKVKKVEQLLKDGKVLFVGDGINDAPVITRSDIGIAMGGLGSHAAIEAADIVIMDDDLEKIDTAIEISQKTIRVVKQNIAISLIVKGAVLILGAVGLSTLWQGIIADVGVAIVAILNSLRLINTKRI